MKQKKDLHVLYIITKLELGGAQKVCLSLKKGLGKSGHIPLLLSGDQGELVQEAKKDSHVYLLKSFKHEFSFFSLFYELKNFIQIVRQIKKLKKYFPNLIVHTHSTKAGLIGRWAALFAGIKKRIHTVHGYAFHKHQNKLVWFVIYFLELVTSFITTHYVCVSSKDVKSGIKLFPGFSRKHSIIRAAVDWQQFYQPARVAKNFPQKNEPFVFGTIACFKKQKNMFDLLNAFKNVHKKHSNTRLELIGDGKLRPNIETWIKKNNLSNYIKLLGWQKKVAPHMIDWHAFVLSSLWEGLPCVVVEARLLKIPVLSYDTGGIHDVIINGKNGFLYQQKDIESLTKGMITIIKDKALFSKLQTFEENLYDFKDSQMVDQHITLYQKLLNQP